MTASQIAAELHTYFEGSINTLEAIQLADRGYTADLLEANYGGLPKVYILHIIQ